MQIVIYDENLDQQVVPVTLRLLATSGVFERAASCWTSFLNAPLDKLCESLHDPPDLSHVPAIRHGNTYEEVALKKFSEITGKKLLRSGLCIHPAFPYLGASPDSFVEGEDAVVEAKCPFKGRNSKGHCWRGVWLPRESWRLHSPQEKPSLLCSDSWPNEACSENSRILHCLHLQGLLLRKNPMW